jgi:hypothetical protein
MLRGGGNDDGAQAGADPPRDAPGGPDPGPARSFRAIARIRRVAWQTRSRARPPSGRPRARVRFQSTFARLRSYRAAEAAAIERRLGLWGACVTPPTTPTTTTTATTTPTSSSTTTTSTTSSSTTTTTPPTNCAPSYPDVCIPPPPPDLDCSQIPYRNFRVIYTVPQPDPHNVDGDRDGIGCES